MKTFKSLLFFTVITLAITPFVATAQSNNFIAKKYLPSAIRAGKVAGYAGLTGFCGVVTALCAHDSLLDLGKLKNRLRNVVRYQDLTPFIEQTDNGFEIPAKTDLKNTFKDASFTALAGYMTLYFAKKTKEAYSA